MSDLAARLRAETQALHTEAERSGYVQKILKKQASQKGYALFLRNLQPAYQALERNLSSHIEHPILGLFGWPELFRREAIDGDLTALAGRSWLDTLPTLPAGAAYAARIDDVAATAPVRLIGHAYVRYIGDLSGGQIVKALLTTSPGLTADMLTFYDFPGIADAGAYKHEFRLALDRAGVLSGEEEAIVDEALTAFRLNIDLSLALQDALSLSGEDG